MLQTFSRHNTEHNLSHTRGLRVIIIYKIYVYVRRLCLVLCPHYCISIIFVLKRGLQRNPVATYDCLTTVIFLVQRSDQTSRKQFIPSRRSHLLRCLRTPDSLSLSRSPHIPRRQQISRSSIRSVLGFQCAVNILLYTFHLCM